MPTSNIPERAPCRWERLKRRSFQYATWPEQSRRVNHIEIPASAHSEGVKRGSNHFQLLSRGIAAFI